MKSFETAKRRAPDYLLEFELDGEKYHFTPPKTTGMWLSSFEDGGETIRSQLDWLGVGLEPDESEHLLARLKDPADDLDLGVVLQVIRWLIEEVTGRPTGPPSDS